MRLLICSYAAAKRAGFLGLTPAFAVRHIVERFAEVLLAQETTGGYVPEELPARMSLPRGAQAILIGDFLTDRALISAMIESIAERGARGHLVMIQNPVEESFPFSGILNSSMWIRRRGCAWAKRKHSGQTIFAVSPCIAMPIAAAARARDWTLMVHRTDRPATEALLALRVQLDANPGFNPHTKRGAAR